MNDEIICRFTRMILLDAYTEEMYGDRVIDYMDIQRIMYHREELRTLDELDVVPILVEFLLNQGYVVNLKWMEGEHYISHLAPSEVANRIRRELLEDPDEPPYLELLLTEKGRKIGEHLYLLYGGSFPPYEACDR